MTGAGLIESLDQLLHGVQSRDWVDITLGGVATTLDAFAVTIDPLGTVAAWGFSWLIEHLKPLKNALDSLAGDPGQIHGQVQTWQSVARVVRGDREQISAEVRKLAQNWTGTSGSAARQHTEQHQRTLDDMARAAEIIAAIVGGGALLVALVRGLVRDLIAQLLATLAVRIPSWVAAEAGSLGSATPAIVGQALALVGQCGKKISALLSALKSSMQRLGRHITDLGHLIEQMRGGIAKADHHVPDVSLTITESGKASANAGKAHPQAHLSTDEQMAVITENLKRSNPRYNPMNIETSQNCANSVVAYDLRARGFAVEAKSLEEGWARETLEIERLYGKKFEWASDHTKDVRQGADQIYTHIIDSSPGARGFLAAIYKTPVLQDGHIIGYKESGHIMVAENVGTRTRILDPQQNSFKSWHGVDNDNLVELLWLRTDNLDVGPQAFDFVQPAK